MPGRILLMAFAAFYPIATFHDRTTSNHVKYYALALFTLCFGILWLRNSTLRPVSLIRNRAIRTVTLLYLLLSAYSVFLLKLSIASILIPLTFFLVVLAIRDLESFQHILPRRRTLVLFALIGVVVLCCFANSNQFTALAGSWFRRTGLATFGCCVVIFLATLRHVTSPEDGRRTIGCLLAGSSIVGLIGLAQFFGQDGFMLAVFRDLRADPRPMGTLGHPNWYGTYLLLVLPFAVHRFFLRPQIVSGTLCALLYGNLLVAQTRGAWIGFVAFIALLFLWKWEERRKTLYLLLLFAIVTAILTPWHDWQILKRAGTLSTEAEMAATGSISAGAGRFGFWKYALARLPRYAILGSGLDTLPDIAPAGTAAPVDKAHSIYLEYAVTIGLPGLALYLAFLWACTKRNLRNPSAWTFRAALITYLVQGVFIHDTVHTWPLVWMLAGLSSVEQNEHPTTNNEHPTTNNEHPTTNIKHSTSDG